MSLLLWLTLLDPAHGCTGFYAVHGWAPDLDGAVDVPTDAWLRIDGNSTNAATVELVPVAGGPAISGTLAYDLNPRHYLDDWMVFVPDAPLDPVTEYEARLYFSGYGYVTTTDPGDLVATVRFTTGAGPAETPIAPSMAGGEATVWEPDDIGTWYCLIGNPVAWRDVTVDLTLPEAEPLTWVTIRAEESEPRGGQLFHAEPWPGPGNYLTTFVQARHADDERWPDCFTVGLISASGEEVLGNSQCLEVPAGPDGSDGDGDRECGCAHGGSGGGLPAALIALLGLGHARRRRS